MKENGKIEELMLMYAKDSTAVLRKGCGGGIVTGWNDV